MTCKPTCQIYLVTLMQESCFTMKTVEIFFSIRCNDYKNTQITDEHLMQFPLGMGITGIAINSEKPIVSNEGEEDPRYSFEVDNHLQLLDFENLLVVPLVDSKG